MYVFRAWITVDNKLYLWNLSAPQQYTSYDGITDVIVSVALAVPKPNMFVSSVKYFLVVVTTAEVILLALSWEPNYITDNQFQQGMVTNILNLHPLGGSTPTAKTLVPKPVTDFQLKPTKYILPTDNITIIKVVGSGNGRIFLAGVDGNIHEVTYDTAGEGEDSWVSSLTSQYLQPHNRHDSAVDAHGVRYKCQKLTHSTWGFQLIHLLPSFIRGYVSSEDAMLDMVLDDGRHVLYGVTVRGFINIFYLGVDGTSMTLSVSGFNIQEELVQFLKYSARAGVCVYV